MCARQIAFSLVSLCGIAVIAILRRSHLRNAANKKDIISQHAANKKDIISQHAANKKDIISQHAANKEDFISQLPDDILISIIRRMGTKFAVRTSILSKRWRNLYKFVSDIDFSCHMLWPSASYPYGHEAFIIYELKRFLGLRSGSGSKIRSFHFRCRLTKSHADRFEQCIYSLGKLGIEELALYFSCCLRSSDLSLSCHLLSEMPSLKYFRLAWCSLEPNLKSQCNSLQTLSLMHVKVLPGALECILSNCLSLHSLDIDRCDCPSKLCFRGPNLQLKSLIIKHCKGVEEIEIYASNLMAFEFHKPEVANIIFDHVPQLQSIYLFLIKRNIMSYVFGGLARELPHLKSLVFATTGDFYQESCRFMGIETFSNLRQLELKVYCTPETNLLALTPFLESCPLLQEFHLDMPYLLSDEAPHVQPRKQVALQLKLKKVKISGFRGTKNEIEFALYILKSAVSLEQMHIIRSTRYYNNMRDKTPSHKMMENQLQGQALSRTAQVIIKDAF